MRSLSASDPFEHSAQGDLCLLDIRESFHSNAAKGASFEWATQFAGSAPTSLGSTFTASNSQKDIQ